ncbi:MAG: hypothetical protein Q4Q22_04150 [Methanosphaera sp.]|nr:hypothetical protein [Methanosphaera sp.]
MKKPVFNKIAPTPILEGEDARRFIEHMNDPITERDLEIQKRIKSRREVKIIY